MNKINFEAHELLALALSEHFKDSDIAYLRRLLDTTPYGARLNGSDDESLRAAVVLMGRLPDRVRELVGTLKVEQSKKEGVLNSTRLRQLGQYDFRLVYVGQDSPQAAYEKYCQDNIDELSGEELSRLRDSLITARATMIADIKK